MKKSTLTACLLAFFGWLVSTASLFAQGEFICHKPGANSQICPPTIATTTSRSNEVEVKNSSSSTVTGFGWYKAFWIMGDGNFIYFPTLPYQRPEDGLIHSLNSSWITPLASTSTDDANSRVVNYNYSGDRDYTVVSVLTEKYSNSIPPDLPRKVISANHTAGSVPSASPETKTLNGQPIRMLTNHKPRMGFPTCLTISWQHGNPNPPTTLLLFFNGRKNGASVDQDELNIPSSVEQFPPAYFSNKGLGTPKLEVTLNNSISVVSALSSSFTHCLVFPNINEINGGIYPAGWTEDRMFVTFRTASQLNTTQQNSTMVFRAMFLNGSGVPMMQQDYETDIVLAHDPNSLTVEKYVPQPNGKFKVYLNMRICNDGPIPAEGLTLDIENRFPANTQFSEFERYGSYGPKNFAAHTTNVVRIKYEKGPPAEITIPSVPDAHTNPSNFNCVDIKFIVFTDAAGLAQLKKTDFADAALEAVVEFGNALGDFHKSRNTPIPGDMQPSQDDNKGDPDNSNCILWWVLIGILLLALLLYWIKKVSQ